MTDVFYELQKELVDKVGAKNIHPERLNISVSPQMWMEMKRRYDNFTHEDWGTYPSNMYYMGVKIVFDKNQVEMYKVIQNGEYS